MSTSYYAVASAAIDAPMESGVAVFKGSDPYTPTAEANFYMATVQVARVEIELAALGFMRVDDWHRDVSGYLTATVERLATRHECASRYERTAVHDQGTGRASPEANSVLRCALRSHHRDVRTVPALVSDRQR